MDGTPDRWSPTVRRRRLAAELASLRATDGRSAAEIAQRLGVAESTVVRLEDLRHLTLPKPDLISRRRDVYGVGDGIRDKVSELVTQARTRDWWHRYKRVLSSHDIQYLGLEAEASILRIWNPTTLPDLLQTVEYARALRDAAPRGFDVETSDALDAMHTQRQEFLLAGARPVHLHAVVGETALRRLVGGPAVMHAQLQHLLDQTAENHIVVQAVRDSAGALPERHPFTVVSYLEPSDPEAVRATSAAGATWVEDRAGIIAAETAWEKLVAMAAPIPATRTLIADLARDLP